MPYSAWTTQRTNFCTNPMGPTATSVNNWGVANGATVAFDAPTKGARVTAPVSSVADSGVNLGATISTYVQGVATYTISMDVTGVVADGWKISIQGSWAFANSAYVQIGVGETKRLKLTFVTNSTGARGAIYLLRQTPSVAGQVIIKNVLFEKADTDLGFFDGSFANDTSVPSLFQYIWASTANNSSSGYQTRTYTQPDQGAAVIPIRNLSTSEVLYGDRSTGYRWEVLEHSNGVDRLVGTLDGVSEGSLSWTQNAAVKGTGKASVIDLSEAQRGMLRVADLKLESVRLRPVQVIAGLPENPLGVYLVENAKEDWDDTGRVWNIGLLDRCTVPQQDAYENSYSVAAGTLILQTIKTILASCGEYIDVNASSTLATSGNMVWEAGVSKLTIINDLLDAAGYNALWMDGYGNFQVTPRVLPADRTITYEVLGIPRELRDGAQGIYRPSWSRDKDTFDVPNKVIAIEAAGGEDAPALVGTWTNTDASSPYSYQARGRWIPHVLDSVEVPAGTVAERTTFLQARARATLIQMSATQAQVKVEHLPIPVRVSDVLRFSHKKAGIDSRHVITNLSLSLTATGMMKSTLQEVVSL